MPVRLLILGDIEGKLPKGLKKLIKKEKIDAIINAGDFPDCAATTAFEFLHWGTDMDDAVNRKIMKFMKRDYESGAKILRALDRLGVPVYIVFGNHDDFSELSEISKDRRLKDYSPVVSKMRNVRNMHLKAVKLGGFTLVGHGGYEPKAMLHGRTALTTAQRKKILASRKNIIASVCRLLKGRKDTILLTHDVPYGCGIDVIRNPASPVNGMHIGEMAYAKVIEKCKPSIHVCGHMHENQGMERVGRTLVINGGFGHDGEAAILEIPSRAVKFLKI